MDTLCERMRTIFADDHVNVDEVMEVLRAYKTNKADWAGYALFDEHKYTRNLVDVGNGKYNMMLLCWGPGMGSSIHDHTDAHCFVKVLDGDLLETRFAWPQDDTEQHPLDKIGTSLYPTDGVAYMSDTLGLHRMENPSHSSTAVSLHLYIPPFSYCQMFDERTGKKIRCPVTFWSEYGKKVDRQISKQTEQEDKPVDSSSAVARCAKPSSSGGTAAPQLVS